MLQRILGRASLVPVCNDVQMSDAVTTTNGAGSRVRRRAKLSGFIGGIKSGIPERADDQRSRKSPFLCCCPVLMLMQHAAARSPLGGQVEPVLSCVWQQFHCSKSPKQEPTLFHDRADSGGFLCDTEPPLSLRWRTRNKVVGVCEKKKTRNTMVLSSQQKCADSRYQHRMR